MSSTAGDDAALWRALADPTRRALVDVLRSGPRTTGQLVDQFSRQLVRTAVMKHLGVLEAAGVIRAERRGRNRWNHLDPRPLEGLADWLKRRLVTHETNLDRLKRLAESPSGSGQSGPLASG